MLNGRDVGHLTMSQQYVLGLKVFFAGCQARVSVSRQHQRTEGDLEVQYVISRGFSIWRCVEATM